MFDYGCPGFFNFPDHEWGSGIGDGDRAGAPEEGGGDGGGEAGVPARRAVYVGEGGAGIETLGAEDGGEDNVADATGFEGAGRLVEVEFH